MIDTLDNWHWKSMPDQDEFVTHQDLQKKIGHGGGVLPFYGNTVVFDLNERDKEKIAMLQASLYAEEERRFNRAGAFGMPPETNIRCLAQRLDPSTLHMTLHDLHSNPGFRPEQDEELKAVEARADSLLRQWRGQKPLHMSGTWVFNMMNTSLVLGLKPKDHDTYLKLCEMHKALQEVYHLDYKLCPHITLAYFRPGVYKREILDQMRNLTFPAHSIDVTLSMRDLHVMTFRSMNDYTIVEYEEDEV